MGRTGTHRLISALLTANGTANLDDCPEREIGGTMKPLIALSVAFLWCQFVGLGTVQTSTAEAEAVLKGTIKLMREMADVLKLVKDKASAEGALPKLKTINARLAVLKKKDIALSPDEMRQLFAKHKAAFEATAKALGAQVAQIHKLPEAKGVLTKDLSLFEETSKTMLMMREAKASAARVQIKAIARALQIYKLKSGKFPSSLSALTEGKNAILKENDLYDPWENPYLYDPTGPRNESKMPDVWTRTPEGVIIGNWEKKP